jgi:hypothetical protein
MMPRTHPTPFPATISFRPTGIEHGGWHIRYTGFDHPYQFQRHTIPIHSDLNTHNLFEILNGNGQTNRISYSDSVAAHVQTDLVLGGNGMDGKNGW